MNSRRLFLLGTIVIAGCATAPRAEPTPSPTPVVSAATVPPRIGGADVIRPDPPRRDTAAIARDSVARAALARVQDSLATARADSLRATIDTVGPETLLQQGPLLSLDSYAKLASVTRYVTLFSGDAKARIGQRLSAGTKYDAMIRDRLRLAGIPEEFTYLALIESGYDPDSYSSAAAVGMWQFMAGTARGAGLRVDWWIDDRRDPVRETDAAVRFLVELRDQFGSMYLAAAAYNGGPGRVSRGLTRLAEQVEDDEPEDKFFTLASSNVLRAETKNYVPQLIAAALIMRDPVGYGITIDTQPPFVYDSVSVRPLISLGGVALACGTTSNEIVSLNGQILRGMTPPSGSAVWVKVPRGCGAGFDSALAALDDSTRRGAAWHTAKKGETPTSIAKKEGISLKTLRVYNPKFKTAANDPIASGTKVLIPEPATVKAARDVPDPSIERYGVAVGGSYVVRRGDTLGGIAARNSTTVSAIKRANAMKSDRIVVGQTLRVPRGR